MLRFISSLVVLLSLCFISDSTPLNNQQQVLDHGGKLLPPSKRDSPHRRHDVIPKAHSMVLVDKSGSILDGGATQRKSNLIETNDFVNAQKRLMRRETIWHRAHFHPPKWDERSFMQLDSDTDKSEARSFRLLTSVGGHHLLIPKDVFLTGPFPAFDAVFWRRKYANLFKWLGFSQDVKIRYFNDSACRSYIHRHYDAELTAFFDRETHGSYRGDLCRTAILLKNGGFYVDLDMQLRVPLTRLVDDATTFMTARSYMNGALNALIAAAPNSPILSATLAHMRKWYRNETKQESPMGPVTMQRGIEEVIQKSCPGRNWTLHTAFPCGKERSVRLYTEIKMKNCSKWGDVICPRIRSKRKWDGLKFGLFAGSLVEMLNSSQLVREQNFVGWSRALDCRSLGCRMSGGRRYA